MDNSPLQGKKIIIGVTGSIAAYKAVLLVRLLVKQGAEVQVLMSEAAKRFVSPLTFSTLSKKPVYADVSSEEGWNNHVELGLWADLYVVAPATANTIAQFANGLCNNILSAVYLSARCPVLIAPAMDLDMWEHPSTVKNINQLEIYGDTIIPVGEGALASGLSGKGRLAEPEDIISLISNKVTAQHRLAGKKILLTAGPTHEAIDPVRFIGNHSSGKMGIAIANALIEQGAEVHLILGPSSVPVPKHSRLHLKSVKSADQMLEACQKLWHKMDMGIMTAAVADYRPLSAADQKIKKSSDELTITLVKNPDIAASLGKVKTSKQRLIGFALETENGKSYALDKMRRKNFDAIVLNLHTAAATAFGGDDNQVTILQADGTENHYPRMSKQAVAKAIVKELIS